MFLGFGVVFPWAQNVVAVDCQSLPSWPDQGIRPYALSAMDKWDFWCRRFPICNTTLLRKLFECAGLEQVTARALDVTTRFTSFDDYWQPFLIAQGSALSDLETRYEVT